MSKLVTVATYTSPWDAHIAKGRLEAEGITSFIPHEHHVWANWSFSNALGGVRLQVIAEHAAMAEKILAAHSGGDYESALQEEFPNIKDNACPDCGSDDYGSSFSIWTLILVILTLGVAVIFPIRRENHKCRKCCTQWKA